MTRNPQDCKSEVSYRPLQVMQGTSQNMEQACILRLFTSAYALVLKISYAQISFWEKFPKCPLNIIRHALQTF